MCICSTFDFERGCGGLVELQDIHCVASVSALESSSEATIVFLGACRLFRHLAAKSLEELSPNILLLNKDGNYNPFTKTIARNKPCQTY